LTCTHCGGTYEGSPIDCPHCGARLLPVRRLSRTPQQTPPETNPHRARRTGRADEPPAAPLPAASRHRSMPSAAPAKSTEAPRMVRPYRPPALDATPPAHENFHWLRLCLVSFVCVLVVGIGSYVFLSRSMPGQTWLASMGREASAEAYHRQGQIYMAKGSILKAVWALEVAQSKETNDLEILLDLGKAYAGAGLAEQAEVAYARAIAYWPAHPEAYRQLISLLMEQDRRYEAVQLSERAIEASDDAYFETLYQAMQPGAPRFSQTGTRLDAEIDLTLSVDDPEAAIYYTLTGEDPKLTGTRYTKPIHLPEGVWKVRAITEKEGVFSREGTQTYTISKPSPDAPAPSLASGTYSSVRTVSLRAPAGVDIYYTTDGTAPTPQSKKFITGQPIALRIGKTVLRAVAYFTADDTYARPSNEMRVEYECEGRTLTAMTDKDTIDGLTLYKTTRSQFITKYGQPTAEAPDGEDAEGSYTKLTYAFGYAVFLDRGTGSEAILAELYTMSTAFEAPRKTKVGMRMEDVLAQYRDGGGEANAEGNRQLYYLILESGDRIGMLTKGEDGEYSINYYHEVDKNRFIQLTYHIRDGLVSAIEWLRYAV
jgi:tetratricopeptide (TPR) repeat protein/DNA-directed RNA polymerase subunit RPC12/RpoP